MTEQDLNKSGDLSWSLAFLVKSAEEISPFFDGDGFVEESGASFLLRGRVEVPEFPETLGEMIERGWHSQRRMIRTAPKSKIAPPSRRIITRRPFSESRSPRRCPPVQAARTLQMLRVE